MTRAAWSPTGSVVPALLLLVLGACSSTTRPGGPGSTSAVAAAATSASSGSSTSRAVSTVSCSGSTCSVTLAGSGSQAHVLGTTIVFGSADRGRATLRVGDRTVTCTPGQRVSAGPLSLTCTTVADGAVSLTASLG